VDEHKPGVSTIAIHAGEEPDPATGALVPPLHLANTFHLRTAEEGAALFSGEKEGFVYSRWGSPTVSVLEKRVAALEHAEAALATASGMAAIATAVLNIVHAGDHIVAARAIYPSTFHLFDVQLRGLGVETTLVDATNVENIARALRKNTRVIYLESPGNPLLALCDLAATAKLAREANVTTICDSTFASPINQNPLDFGIDVVLHSATKYLGGHGDAVGGVIAGRKEFIRHALLETIRFFGGVMSPFNAYLILRGIQTLPLRMRQHNANAVAVARFLEVHPRVVWVSYPGLASHPQHALAQRQMRGFGGMVCFELKGGLEAGARLMNRVRLCSLAVSLGDTRTLIVHPASTTHSVVSRETRLEQQVTDGLVRMSVGLEDAEDIIADLEQGLRA
jgi:methionine-gamma-lyase